MIVIYAQIVMYVDGVELQSSAYQVILVRQNVQEIVFLIGYLKKVHVQEKLNPVLLEMLHQNLPN
jgi:hypothetical protein